jgi:Arc/MetJ-type ribon-helix-helix transcriptional regulator
MIQTLPRLAPQFLNDEFNKFLFALVGTDRFGSQLSVVSALARLDLDAWDEAAALARLPREAAVTKLSTHLRRYPEIPRITQESGAIAARLITLLPRSAIRSHTKLASRGNWVAASAAGGLGILVALAMLIGLQYATRLAPLHPAAVLGNAVHAAPATPQPKAALDPP